MSRKLSVKAYNLCAAVSAEMSRDFYSPSPIGAFAREGLEYSNTTRVLVSSRQILCAEYSTRVLIKYSSSTLLTLITDISVIHT